MVVLVFSVWNSYYEYVLLVSMMLLGGYYGV